jgi:hypothetical protein
MAHNFGNINSQKTPNPLYLLPPKGNKMDLLGACCLTPLAGRIIIIILGHKWTNSIAQRKKRKHATQPGPEGNPKPTSPKVTFRVSVYGAFLPKCGVNTACWS